MARFRLFTPLFHSGQMASLLFRSFTTFRVRCLRQPHNKFLFLFRAQIGEDVARFNHDSVDGWIVTVESFGEFTRPVHASRPREPAHPARWFMP